MADNEINISLFDGEGNNQQRIRFNNQVPEGLLVNILKSNICLYQQ